MSGNVWQWVQDKYQDSYKGVPVDGSAFKGAGSRWLYHGGGFRNSVASRLRADGRQHDDPGSRNTGAGFRLAR